MLSSIIFCFLIAWEIFKYYRKKEDRKNKINKLITEYKLIALKAQINPHFMSNCLTAIQQLIITNKLVDANQYLAKFSFLVRQVLNFSSMAAVTLKEELSIANLNIELEQLRFDNKFEVIVSLDKNIDMDNFFVLPMILQPIIENAIWHGLLPLKNKKGLLKIDVIVIKNQLKFVIEDNGVGRKQNLNDITNNKESKGLAITKQRIRNLNNWNELFFDDLIIEDLYDEFENPLGTRVIIYLPIQKNNIYDED